MVLKIGEELIVLTDKEATDLRDALIALFPIPLPKPIILPAPKAPKDYDDYPFRPLAPQPQPWKWPDNFPLPSGPGIQPWPNPKIWCGTGSEPLKATFSNNTGIQ